MKIYLKLCYAGIGCQHDINFVKLCCELQQDDAGNCEEHLNCTTFQSLSASSHTASSIVNSLIKKIHTYCM